LPILESLPDAAFCADKVKGILIPSQQAHLVWTFRNVNRLIWKKAAAEWVTPNSAAQSLGLSTFHHMARLHQSMATNHDAYRPAWVFETKSANNRCWRFAKWKTT